MVIDKIIAQSSLVIHKADVVPEEASFELAVVAKHQIGSFVRPLVDFILIKLAFLEVVKIKIMEVP